MEVREPKINPRIDKFYPNQLIIEAQRRGTGTSQGAMLKQAPSGSQ